MTHVNQVKNNNVQIKLRTRIKRQIKSQRIRITFHDIIGFGIISKISVKLRDNDFTITNSTADISLENFRDFEGLFLMAASKVIAIDKNMFKVGIKVTNTASINVMLLSLVEYLERSFGNDLRNRK